MMILYICQSFFYFRKLICILSIKQSKLITILYIYVFVLSLVLLFEDCRFLIDCYSNTMLSSINYNSTLIVLLIKDSNISIRFKPKLVSNNFITTVFQLRRPLKFLYRGDFEGELILILFCFLNYYQFCVDKFIVVKSDLIGVFRSVREIRYCFCLFSFVELVITQWVSAGPNIIVIFLILELKTLTLASMFEFATDVVKDVFNCLTSKQISTVTLFRERLIRPLRDVVVQNQLSVSQMCKNLSFASNIVNEYCMTIRSKSQLSDSAGFTTAGTRFFASRYNAVVLLENEAISGVISTTFKQVVWESELWKKDALWVSISESLLSNDFRLNFNVLPNTSKFSSSINTFIINGTTPISVEQIKSFHENFCLVDPNVIQIEPNVEAPKVIQIEPGNLDNSGNRWWTILGLVVVVGVVGISLYYTGGFGEQYNHVGEMFDDYLKTQLENR